MATAKKKAQASASSAKKPMDPVSQKMYELATKNASLQVEILELKAKLERQSGQLRFFEEQRRDRGR